MRKIKKKNHYRFKNKVLKTSKYKVNDIPQKGWDFPVDLLYPMVEGPAINLSVLNGEITIINSL